jgi:integrase/recombinase XerD
MATQNAELLPITWHHDRILSDHRRLLGQLFHLAGRKQPPRRIDDTITAFLAQYSNPETRRTYGKTLSPFAEAVGTHRALESITPELMDTWHQGLCQRDLAPATIASRTKMIKIFWNWCVRREYITQNPARFLVVRPYNKLLASKAIPGDILRAMFDAAQHKPCAFLAARDTAILALLITYGARVGDVARLTLEDIRLDEHQIVFHLKGTKKHLLPLPDQTSHYLANWLALRSACTPDPTHHRVFVTIHTRPGHRHAPLTATGMATLIRRLSQHVGRQGYGPHAIRHWRGQTLADQRVPPTIVQAILGHSHVRTTLIHYYNQDWPRLQQVLTTQDLAFFNRSPPP